MSFAGDIREELSLKTGGARHCMIAELASILSFSGTITITPESGVVCRVRTENLATARKAQALMREAFSVSVSCSVRVRMNGRKNVRTYVICAYGAEAERILRGTRLLNENTEESLLTKNTEVERNGKSAAPADELIVQRSCCRRAYLRGAFLCAGSVSDPRKSYHFEISCSSEPRAEQIRTMMEDFALTPGIVLRRGRQVVYLKESDQVADMLRVIGADRSVLDFENIRAERELINSVNRKLNCDTANINKIVRASEKQAEDIEYIDRTVGLGSLPENLRQTAQLRTENLELSLEDLGKMLTPPLGKSGVNHRLQKISEIANRLREERHEHSDGRAD